MGVVQRHDNILMIVPPSQPVSTGCQWARCLLPTYVEGLILTCEENQDADVVNVWIVTFLSTCLSYPNLACKVLSRSKYSTDAFKVEEAEGPKHLFPFLVLWKCKVNAELWGWRGLGNYYQAHYSIVQEKLVLSFWRLLRFLIWKWG